MTEKAVLEIIETIIEKIDLNESSINNRELLNICRDFNFLRNPTNVHLAHEIVETAFNELIKNKYAQSLLKAGNQARNCREILRPLHNRMPTESWRSLEQNKWQQFSTPPVVAYLLTYLLNLQDGEAVLEPSAGTGCLAVWPQGTGSLTHTNEIDASRKFLLEQLGFHPTSYDAEFINDFLPIEIEVDCLLMNPPFSSTGGRTKNNSSRFGFRHVDSALQRLKPGGRFGIILGEASGLDTKTGNDFWRRLSDRIEVKSIVKIDGREYRKMGTTVDINLITGSKLLETRKTDWNQQLNKIINLSVSSVEEAFAKVDQLNLRLDH